ncbi:tetratricopeptide repeat-containing sensor histidine kinase [Mucilaginibacter pineti]|uniref:tetratricopeptide repeat-containing sensor histidine kinase n=1 Tax=Mucilaginibacter pineti TaxID=1391627 RepID=UPI0013BEA54E|nr:ATP-binding protein [Mucilaginibacter pineti]
MVLLLCICGFTVFAQHDTIVSLKKWHSIQQKANYRSDTAAITTLNELSEGYRYNNTNRSLYFAKQAFELAAFQKNQLAQATSILNISTAYYVMGSYSLSLDAASRLMQISNTINYKPGEAGSYQIIGLIFLAQNNYTEAIKQFGKALDRFTELNDQRKIVKILFNLGVCYDEGKQPYVAFSYLNRALKMSLALKDEHIVSMCYNRMGETYFHLKDYQQALINYEKVLSQQYQDNWEQTFAYSGIAQSYYALADYKQAVSYAGKSLKLADETNSRWDAVRALKILSDSYAALSDYPNAYNYQAMLKKYSDSLLNSDRDNEINYLHLKQQQADNARLQKEVELNKQKLDVNNIIIIAAGILAIFGIVVVVVIGKNNMHKTLMNKQLQKKSLDIELQNEEISRQKEALDELNHTKDQLFSVISHDLRSPFASVLQTLELIRAGELGADEKELVLESFYQQVTLVSIMVNNLLIWANSQQKGIFAERSNLNVADVANEIISVSSYLAKNKHISIIHSNHNDNPVIADINHVKIIVQNLIGNAIKFTPEGGTIEVSYSNDEHYQCIHVKDSGIGIPQEKMDQLFKIVGKQISGYGTNKEAGAGIGLALIKQFVDVNEGKIIIKSEPGNGTEFIVCLKKAELPHQATEVMV